LCFKQLDILNLNEVQDQFDLVYTERVIINLSDWYTQRRAIENVFQLLKPGGAFIMCENSQNGLNDINELRLAVGLEPYQAPWHNRYLVDAEIQQIEFPGVTLETIDYYSSTYYLLSRVVNAWMAQQEGEEPKYESPINKLALKLPAIGNFGQGRIWVWRKGL
jgi:Nodulation protein S (NodS).